MENQKRKLTDIQYTMINKLLSKKRMVLMASMIILVSATEAQKKEKEYVFMPDWKAGEKKTITTKDHTIEYEEGEKVKDVTVTYQTFLEVVKKTDKAYQLKMVYPMYFMEEFFQTVPGLADSVSDTTTFEVVYSVDRNTIKWEILNWEDVETSLLTYIDEVKPVIEKGFPDNYEEINKEFISIQDYLKKDYYLDGLDLDELLGPYNKVFILGTKLPVKDSTYNSFSFLGGKEWINIVNTIHLETVGKKNEYELITTIDTRTGELMIKAILESFNSMLKMVDKNHPKYKEFSDKLAALSTDVEMSGKSKIMYDDKSRWIRRIEEKGQMSVQFKGKGVAEISTEGYFECVTIIE